jgi:hypothetical protein
MCTPAKDIAGGAIGLIGGGVLTTYASWRWVLFVNVPIGAAVALAAPRVLAETACRRGRFDLPGALTGTAGIAALVYGLVSAATSPNGKPSSSQPAPSLSSCPGSVPARCYWPARRPAPSPRGPGTRSTRAGRRPQRSTTTRSPPGSPAGSWSPPGSHCSPWPSTSP